MAAKDAMDLSDLRCRLCGAYEGTNSGEFIPNGTLPRLFTVPSVTRTLQGILGGDLRDDQILQYARRICHIPATNEASITYHKTFAILVLIQRPEEILHFLDNNVGDSYLPLSSFHSTEESGSSISLYARDVSMSSLSFLQRWSTADCREFYDRQWGVLAPCFKSGKDKVPFQELHEKSVLPWTFQCQSPNRGGYATVRHVHIHKQHHNFDSVLGDGTFAIKCLDARASEEDFMHEMTTLERFSHKNHPHLISLLATFRHGSQYNLLFHWADLNLHDVLRKDDHKLPGDLTWMMEQCRGLAQAVYAIHNSDYHNQNQSSHALPPESQIGPNAQRYGRHGDIKPQNILLYKKKDKTDERGVLQLADFGICEFHGTVSRSGMVRSGWACSPTYSPPEANMGNLGVVSRSFDVWSLGCVYLEFVTWFLGGPDLGNIFTQARKTERYVGIKHDWFFHVVDGTAHVNPAVESVSPLATVSQSLMGSSWQEFSAHQP